jgi:hypothetical protein
MATGRGGGAGEKSTTRAGLVCQPGDASKAVGAAASGSHCGGGSRVGVQGCKMAQATLVAGTQASGHGAHGCKMAQASGLGPGSPGMFKPA